MNERRNHAVIRFGQDRRGTAAIEFGIVINVFMAIVLAIFAFGYGLSVRSDLTRSLMAAERHALIFEENDTDLSSLVKQGLADYDPDKLEVELTRTSVGGMTYVRAKLTYRIDIDVGLGIGPINLHVDRTFPT